MKSFYALVFVLCCSALFFNDAQEKRKPGQQVFIGQRPGEMAEDFDFPEGVFSTTTGATLDLAHYREGRVLFFLFALDGSLDEQVGRVAEAVNSERGRVNLTVIGVNYKPGKMDPALAGYLKKIDHSFPVILDPEADLVGQLRVRYTTDLVYFDRGGRYVDRISGYAIESIPNRADYFRKKVEELVGIKKLQAMDPKWGTFPDAPSFRFTTIEGKDYSIDDFKGKVIILTILSPTCSECIDKMMYLKTLYDSFHAEGLEIILVSIFDAPEKMTALLEIKKMPPFHVTSDPDYRIRTLYNHMGHIPESYVIDREGKIRFRHQVFKRVERRLLLMEVRHLLGVENPLMFRGKEYGGAEMCRICHEREYFQWKFTGHAAAYETLLASGKENETACLACHVVGPGEPGGFNLDKPLFSARLAGVQCESCHGYGGPHKTKDQPDSAAAYEPVCLACHTQKFSPHFDFKKALALVDHSNAEELFSLSAEERNRLFEQRRGIQDELLAPRSAFVGAKSCAACHEKEYASWSETPHARAFRTLVDKKEDRNTACIGCHVTGYGFKGGYDPAKPKRMKHVQCEACHGPGAAHVKAEKFHKKKTIISLAGKCDECGVEQICMRCHDQANDPGFDIRKKIGLVSH
jgi:peroxiredoxin